MGGLAHYIEQEGIPTTQISLIREHTVRMRPPRALVVPFELGRPFGAPDMPEFQRDVLLTVLNLLERNDGPMLEDYPHPQPGPPVDMEGWSCPVNLAPPQNDLNDSEKLIADVKQEINLLRPWYDESVKNNQGRRLEPLTEFSPETIVDFVVKYLDDPSIENPIAHLHISQTLKHSLDDLKHFYFQAALARPGAVSDVQLGSWFYGETQAGQIVIKLRELLIHSEDPLLKRLGITRLIPYHQAHLTESS